MCFTLFLKVGFHWIFPRDCIVGLHQAGPPGESWEGIRVGSYHYMLVYSSGGLETIGYTDLDFQGDIDSRKSTSEENLADPFIKTLPVRVFEKHVDYMGVKSLPDLF